jgi:DNA primase
MNRFEKLISTRPKAQHGANHEYLIRCPYHKDNKPSMGVNVAKGLFICYACGEKGNATKLTKKLLPGISWKDEAEYFEPSEASDVREEIRLPSEYRGFFPTTKLGKEGRIAWDYLTGRSILPQFIREFRLGYCVTGTFAHRVIIPVYTRGALKTFFARDFTGHASTKMKYPKGSAASLSLFGYDRAVVLNAQMVVIVEGWADAFALLRIFNASSALMSWGAVALGTNHISAEQAQLLAKFTNFIVLLDNDEEGQKATRQVTAMLSLFGKVRMAKLEYSKDPGEADDTELVHALLDAVPYTVR